MAGNGTYLIFPAGNINNSETRRGELSAAPEIIPDELAGLRGDALLTRALSTSLAAERCPDDKSESFSAYIDARARCRPAECTDGPNCWVTLGPPGMGKTGGAGKKGHCLACDGLPVLGPWRSGHSRYRRW